MRPLKLNRNAGLATLLRRLLCALVLVCQNLSAAQPLQSAAAARRGELAAATVLCQGSHAPGPAAPARHHAADPAILYALASAAHAAALVYAGPFLPPPTAIRAGIAWRQHARGPPAPRLGAFYPTGPPRLV